MQLRRRRFEGKVEKCSLWDYQALVMCEKGRSERHNRFFVLLGLIVFGPLGEDLVDLLQDQLRASDHVFLLPNPSDPIQTQLKIGMLLPETDLQGAMVVRERLNCLCSARGIQIRMGQAVYPDDGTVPENLLELCFKAEYQHFEKLNEPESTWSKGTGG